MDAYLNFERRSAAESLTLIICSSVLYCQYASYYIICRDAGVLEERGQPVRYQEFDKTNRES